MRVAVIDLGTNSVRFDVHQIGPGKEDRRLHREKIMVRLGQGAFLSKKLDDKAVNRTLHALLKFKQVANRLHVGRITAFGTSALREVEDREPFVRKIRKTTGINLRVISGSEEARLIALGILTNEALGKEKTALVDIGGGSTEISVCRGKKVLFSESFPLGVARLHQIFLKKSPPDPDGIKRLRAHVRSVLARKFDAGKWPSVSQIIGSSGTVRTISRILKLNKDSDEIRLNELKDLTDEMGSMTTTELLNVPGMESKRVDMILAGALIFEECMKMLEAKRAKVTEFSLRDGIIEEQKNLLRSLKRGSRPKDILVELYQKAAQFGSNEAHLRRSVKIAETLFKKLHSLHRLNDLWMLYLAAATIFRDVGVAVSPVKHEEHSFYIVKGSRLPKLEEWEIEFIARLCLHHEGAKLTDKELDFLSRNKHKEAFLKLLAILQIADALDTGEKTQVELERVRPNGKIIELILSGHRLTGLEILNIERRNEFFERVFRRSIVASQRC